MEDFDIKELVVQKNIFDSRNRIGAKYEDEL